MDKIVLLHPIGAEIKQFIRVPEGFAVYHTDKTTFPNIRFTDDLFLVPESIYEMSARLHREPFSLEQALWESWE